MASVFQFDLQDSLFGVVVKLGVRFDRGVLIIILVGLFVFSPVAYGNARVYDSIDFHGVDVRRIGTRHVLESEGIRERKGVLTENHIDASAFLLVFFAIIEGRSV